MKSLQEVHLSVKRGHPCLLGLKRASCVPLSQRHQLMPSGQGELGGFFTTCCLMVCFHWEHLESFRNGVTVMVFKQWSFADVFLPYLGTVFGSGLFFIFLLCSHLNETTHVVQYNG